MITQLRNNIFKLIGGLAVIILFLTIIGCTTKEKSTKKITLKEKIAQMVMVGFRGAEIKEGDFIYTLVKDHNIGGVVLYNRDLPSKDQIERNIVSPSQLRKLNSDLQAIASTKLLISIDEEGGFVSRLEAKNGFQNHNSHYNIGKINLPDSTKTWAKNMASELSELGINMNFGPVIDLNVNPKNPIIGLIERSFSNNIESVISNASIFIKTHNEKNILCVPKHFPGHGSSDKDSHKGLANVTKTWSKKELIPFKKLIDKKFIKVIMTSHVYNENLDTLPSTLSPKIINNLLRKDLKFKGVIISDDMQMRAISNFYDFETAIEKAIVAGVDMLLFSNNAAPCPKNMLDCKEIPFDPEIAIKAINCISKLVAQGKISEDRINISYKRIIKLKSETNENL